MRLSRALKQKRAHPVLLPAQPPLPAPLPGVPHLLGHPTAWGDPLCRVLHGQGAPSPGVPHGLG